MALSSWLIAVGRVHVVHLTECQLATNPRPNKPTDLGCGSVYNWQLPSTYAIAIYYSNSALKLLLTYRTIDGRRLSQPRHCRKERAAVRDEDCVLQWLFAISLLTAVS